MVPVESYGREAFSGAVVLRVGSDGELTRVARITPEAGRIERSFVVDDRLVTLASAGIESRELADLGG